MRRFRPIHGVALVLVFFAAVLAAEWLLEGGLRRQAFERVSPDTNGMVILDVSDLGPNQVRFYRFLNAGNQEIKFFLGRDEHGVIQAAFDASENDFKMKRGFRYHDGWMVNNKCETSRSE